jgi:cobalt-zinc-cadmium efflux system protein
MVHSHEHHSTDNLRVAFFLNLSFALLEVVGGLWTNSLAILADSVHDLGDSLSLGIAWGLERYSRRGEDRRFSYGYRRYSLLGALINTVVLVVGSLFVLSEAVPRLLRPEHTNAQGMALFALMGIVANGAAVLRLRGEGGLNARVAAWHLMEDVLGWVAVLIVSITLMFADIHVLDPILSVLITLYVLTNVVGNLHKTLALFLQAVPESVSIDEIETRLLAMERVHSIHHTHVWSMDGEHHVLTTHVRVDEGATRADVRRIKEKIKSMSEDLDCTHTTIEIEYGDEGCSLVEARAGSEDGGEQW